MNSDINDQDKQLFQQAVANIGTIQAKYDVSMPGSTPSQSANGAHELDATAHPSWFAQDMIEESYKVGANDTLFFSKVGVQQQQLKRLKQGRLRIEATLDLHGYTVANALSELNPFIANCQQQGHRLVLIIHGKGNTAFATLKSLLNQELRSRNSVLSFCSAKAQHGGTGALYVLLKSINQGNHLP